MIPEECIYKVETNNTQILNSYKIKSIKDMKSVLLYIRKQYPLSVFAHNQRSMFSLINEWRAHNLLYKLGIAKERTKHVDLNLGNTSLMDLGYFLLSIFYF